MRKVQRKAKNEASVCVRRAELICSRDHNEKRLGKVFSWLTHHSYKYEQRVLFHQRHTFIVTLKAGVNEYNEVRYASKQAGAEHSCSCD